ncbi:MAG: AMP-binding protein, partial [Myxococcota bacterium]
MTDVYEVAPEVAQKAHIDNDKYLQMYEASVEDPEGFWQSQIGRLTWYKEPTKVKNVSYEGEVQIKWFEDGELNVCYNCLDRHLEKRGDQTAIIYEGDSPDVSRNITYREAHEQVCRLANVLRAQGVAKGDRVMIYMPMIPEATYAMLACARIGAIHSVVFGGFSPEAIADRIKDAQAKVIITSDGGQRGGKDIPLKANVDAARAKVDWPVHAMVFT